MKFQYQDCYGSRVRSISRKIDGIYRKHLADAGVTENQLSIMMALFETGEIEQYQIGNYLNLEKSSLSRNLVRIMEAGYVKKDGPVNRPVIALTSEGRAKVDELTPRWERAMEEVSGVLSASDIRGFNQFEKQIQTI